MPGPQAMNYLAKKMNITSWLSWYAVVSSAKAERMMNDVLSGNYAVPQC